MAEILLAPEIVSRWSADYFGDHPAAARGFRKSNHQIWTDFGFKLLVIFVSEMCAARCGQWNNCGKYLQTLLVPRLAKNAAE